MTVHELLDHLQEAGVELSLAPEGMLQCRAPQGGVTPALAEALRLAKAELVALLTVRPPVETPPPAVQPAAPARSYRQWVSGHVPQTATIPLAEPLPEPTYHNKPSPCKTYVGSPCPKKGCKGNPTRFWPSRMCTGCWARAKKVTTMSATPE